MSVAEPQNRAEFKQYILTKLGHPVLQVNVADEQMDIAITEAFQYFNERNHFNGVERVYLTTQVNGQMKEHWRSYKTHLVKQQEQVKNLYAEGMVEELELEEPGTAYPTSHSMRTSGAKTTTSPDGGFKIGAETGEQVASNPDGDVLAIATLSDGEGQKLRVMPSDKRTKKGGIVDVAIVEPGYGYKVGDNVVVLSGNEDAIFSVSKVRTSAPVYENAAIFEQNNFITLPDSVVGVTKIIRSGSGIGIGGGIVPPGMIFPMLFGGLTGDQCGNMGFNLVSYFAMMQYLATIEWMMMPPKMYNFNQRTHHLHIDGDLGDVGSVLCLECMVKPDPDMYPDLWNDMWLKELNAYALTKAQWGRNLTKYQSGGINIEELPGGIVMNGDRILCN